MRHWLANHPPDVVNTHSSTDSWLAALACATLARPPAIVRTRHISARVTNSLANRWLYTRAPCRVVTTGESLRQQLLTELGSPAQGILSVPTGIDPARFLPGERAIARQKLGLPLDKRYVGIVATLRSWKGHLYLLEAMARLPDPNLLLLVVGEGPMRQPITDRVTQLGLAERVRLVGRQEKPEEWFQAMDLFCLPSYANEGVPQAILQAMFCALPIITTPVGAIGEAIRHQLSGIMVPPREEEALATAIHALLADPERATRLGLAAREAALARFGLEAMAQAMEGVFMTAAGVTD
jgi:glycosyltransferase involved in cell wall biosynthesis